MKFKNKNLNSFWGGVSICILGAVAFQQTLNIPEAPHSSTLSPQFFPMILSISLCFLGIIMLTEDFFSKKPEDKPTRTNLVPLIFLLMSVVAYIFLLELLGFLLVTFFYLIFTMFLFKECKIINIIIISFVIDICIWGLFTKIFEVALPSGHLWGE